MASERADSSAGQALADREYMSLASQAETMCARRLASATTVSAADSARADYARRMRSLDALSQDELIALAQRRAELR